MIHNKTFGEVTLQFPLDNDLYEMVSSLTKDYSDRLSKSIDFFLTLILSSDKIQPPIKGEITKGKLKHRGITLEVHRLELSALNRSIKYVIKQRGEFIEEFEVSYGIG